jgi:hypothetical protein
MICKNVEISNDFWLENRDLKQYSEKLIKLNCMICKNAEILLKHFYNFLVGK